KTNGIGADTQYPTNDAGPEAPGCPRMPVPNHSGRSRSRRIGQNAIPAAGNKHAYKLARLGPGRCRPSRCWKNHHKKSEASLEGPVLTVTFPVLESRPNLVQIRTTHMEP